MRGTAMLALLVGSYISCSAVGATARPSPARPAAACEFVDVGLDTSYATVTDPVLAFSGRAVAQVFLARDTLISSITVWEPPTRDTLGYGMHLFICGVDSNLKPIPGNILLDGPTKVLLPPSPGTQPVTYTFDPPFALPKPGHYALAIKEEDPWCYGAFVLAADSAGHYPDGGGWIIHPYVDCRWLGQFAIGFTFDVIFDVQFCLPGTPARKTSWGEVKAHYR